MYLPGKTPSAPSGRSLMMMTTEVGDSENEPDVTIERSREE